MKEENMELTMIFLILSKEQSNYSLMLMNFFNKYTKDPNHACNFNPASLIALRFLQRANLI